MKINVRQTSIEICNLFEKLLSKHNIMIPDNNRQDDEHESCIYGDTYYELENEITEILTNILKETKRKDLELETATCDFNTQINGVYYIDEPKINKFAVNIQETLTRTVIVDAASYEDAERLVRKAYHDDDIRLNADNSNVEVKYSDDTDECIDAFSIEEFSKMNQSGEITINKSRPIEFKKEE